MYGSRKTSCKPSLRVYLLHLASCDKRIREHSYVAIKVLTDRFHEHPLYWELRAFTCLSIPQPRSPFCLRLLNYFLISAKGSAKKHLCLATDLLGGDVYDLRRANDGHLPLALCKRILRHTLRGIEYAHRCGVIHTDLKWDNIFLDAPVTADAVGDILLPSSNPTDRPPSMTLPVSPVRTAFPQILPVPSVNDAMDRRFILADFGYGMTFVRRCYTCLVDDRRNTAWPTGEHSGQRVTAIALRAPESFLEGPWNEKVDIWAFGCLVSPTITDRSRSADEPIV